MASLVPESARGALLQNQVTCPHCWTVFPVENTLWIAQAPEQMGDVRLGETEKQRFLPIQFDVHGNAVDLKGFSCEKQACPYCHLYLPHPLLEMPPFFTSIVGAPASGKSYFLTSMIWRLRRALPNVFGISFNDSDPGMNQKLHEYEATHFMNDDPNATAQIEKTQEQGDLYNTVLINNQRITYLQPFLFALSWRGREATAERSALPGGSLSFTLYDNAGESYLPVSGRDTASLPVTRHLAHSDTLFFTFDPIQDNRFRTLCAKTTNDPQFQRETQDSFKKSPLRQEMVLAEMIKRTRSYMGMRYDEKYTKPIIIVMTKLDAWQQLLRGADFSPPWSRMSDGTVALKAKPIRAMSMHLKLLLREQIPEMISMLDQFATDVTFIPVSATGGPPVQNEQTGQWGFRMKDINPIWVEVPALYALARSVRGMISMKS